MTTSSQSPGERSRCVQQPQETPDLKASFAELTAQVVAMWNWSGDDGVTRYSMSAEESQPGMMAQYHGGSGRPECTNEIGRAPAPLANEGRGAVVLRVQTSSLRSVLPTHKPRQTVK